MSLMNRKPNIKNERTNMNVFSVSQPVLTVLSKSKNVGNMKFPVHRIYCVGRNYAEHAIEMGHDPNREPPFFFQKPSDAIVDTYAATAPVIPSAIRQKKDRPVIVPYPPETSSLQFEAELVIAIGTDGLRIPQEQAMDHVYGFAVGCDLTRRDLQFIAKGMGR